MTINIHKHNCDLQEYNNSRTLQLELQRVENTDLFSEMKRDF